MKKFRINLSYHLKDDTVSNQQVTQNYIYAATNSKYEKGIDNRARRILARTMLKLDDAIEKKLEEIEVEEAELDLIKEALKDCKLPAAMAVNSIILEEEVDEALKRK